MRGNTIDEMGEALYRKRHSLAHVLAQAVLERFPEAKLAIGPPVRDGFYYDFRLPQPLSDEGLSELERAMRKIVGQRQTFVRRALPTAEAIAQLESRGDVFKLEMARDLQAAGVTEITFYQSGPFEDMCEGPHVDSTAAIDAKSFKLYSATGAYWRGDVEREQLTRIYGWAFDSEAELKQQIRRREEAQRRDHRKLGQELDLFINSEQVGKGLPLWLPNGTVLRDELERLARDKEFEQGYERVATPHITKEGLYFTSGHLPYYQGSMFPPMEIEGERFYLKPMNCPHHHMIYAARPRSYRDLPLRLAEYGQVYRNEQSGELAGLLRVRGMAMNDAHIYCREDQIQDEFLKVMELHRYYYELFQLKRYWVRLSLSDPKDDKKFVQDREMWERAETLVRDCLVRSGVPFQEARGEAAFYGPKVDFQVENVVGREETASTNQLDMVSPRRFGLVYMGSDGVEHHPFIIHRAPLGTHERFVSFLIEHFGGAFPLWMAPVQVRVLPVGPDEEPYAQYLVARLRKRRRVRADYVPPRDSLGKRVREGTVKKIPHLLILGEREAKEGRVTLRRYGHAQQETLDFGDYLALLMTDIEARTTEAPEL